MKGLKTVLISSDKKFQRLYKTNFSKTCHFCLPYKKTGIDK